MSHAPLPSDPAGPIADRTGPLPPGPAWRGVARCTVTSAAMLGRGEVRWPRDNLERRIAFGDGTSARVYRETAVARREFDPCVLVVTFRLRRVRGRGHAWFRRESVLNTPLFVGFPGFASKLWLAHDEQDRYRGLYDWDGPGLADRYARSLWRVLDLVSEPGSIDYRVLPGVRRADVLTGGGPVADGPGSRRQDRAADWWRPVAAS